MSEKIAGITDGFSFAYMKEAFVASLLRLVTRKKAGRGIVWGKRDGNGLEDLPLWREFRRQVKTLREEFGMEDGGKEDFGRVVAWEKEAGEEPVAGIEPR